MVRCYCGLGGNLGPVREVFDLAIADLRKHSDIQVTSVSSVHVTSAVGTNDEAGGDYLNAAIGLDTNLSSLSLLHVLQSIEAKYGRTRELRWGPRTLDLDLLFYGNEVIESPRLVVPHPGAWFRRFVLDPLSEIAPELRHPIKKLTIRELRERLLPRPLQVALSGGNESEHHELADVLRSEFPQVKFSTWQTVCSVPSSGLEPAFIVWLGRSHNQPRSNEADFVKLPLVPRIAAVPPLPGFLTYVLRASLGNNSG